MRGGAVLQMEGLMVVGGSRRIKKVSEGVGGWTPQERAQERLGGRRGEDSGQSRGPG